MVVYMQALSGNTQKKPVWRGKLGDGGLRRERAVPFTADWWFSAGGHLAMFGDNQKLTVITGEVWGGEVPLGI